MSLIRHSPLNLSRHVFQKWNERLFHEMYQAFLDGRLEKDPSEGWYQGEIGFFDFYIIPLAKKLETCGVFGVSSLEYMSYAQANRQEWVLKGENIVKSYLVSYETKKAQIQSKCREQLVRAHNLKKSERHIDSMV
jgi:hypothetical protein